MRRTTAALGSVIFFALAPGVVAGFVPWWLTSWRVRQPLPFWAVTPLRVFGVALIAAGAVVGSAMAAFAYGYEEPALADRFGAEYEAYRRAVPAWWPRLRPWQPDETDRASRNET